ncbi:MAG: quinol:cytochrome C oxidoreductase [Myxococcales bacterium]|nr:quinol:cytochrome C oxidoreductase [Myxococcales bacterium]
MSGHHTPELPLAPEKITLPSDHPWRKLANLALYTGLGGVALGAASSMMFDGKAKGVYYGSYMFAFLYFLSIILGGLFFVLIHHATRAGWSTVVRRLAEFVMGGLYLRVGGVSLPLMLLLFIPILIGMPTLFHEWVHPDPKDVFLKAKAPYLNVTFFLVRAAFYFAVWYGLSWFFLRNSIAQDESGDESFSTRQRAVSPIGIVLFAMTVTFASFDWIMSLAPHWYSTIFGVYFFAGAQVAIFSTLALFGHGLRRTGLLGDIITTEHYQDLGKLLFGFVVFWSYIAFSQYFLQWYSNIPEETVWYADRLKHWNGLTMVLALGHFVIPFFFLMSKHIKRNPFTLVLACVWMLTIHAIDLFWLVMPSVYHQIGHSMHKDFHFSVVHLLPVLANFVGIGGLVIAGILRWASEHNLVPAKDPRLKESLAFENF